MQKKKKKPIWGRKPPYSEDYSCGECGGQRGKDWWRTRGYGTKKKAQNSVCEESMQSALKTKS